MERLAYNGLMKFTIPHVVATLVVVGAWFWILPPLWWVKSISSMDLTDPVGAGATVVNKYECRSCHQIGGEGGTQGGPSLDGVTWRTNAVILRLWLREPRAIVLGNRMPDFDLSGGEIEAIVAYLTALDAKRP